jgi:hypothetical protein
MQIIITAVFVSIVIGLIALLWRCRSDNPNRIQKTEDSER